MRVAEIVRKPAITIRRDATIRDAACVMRRFNIGFLIVVDEMGNMCGVISERDIVDAIASGLSVDEPVTRIMKTNVITIRPEDSVWKAAKLMLEHGIRHLVVAENGRVEGVISIKDLINIEGMLKLMAELAT